MTCKQVDFDHDGRKDWVVAYNRKGNAALREGRLRLRRQVGHVARSSTRRPAQVAEVERDTDFDGKFDVKEIYDSAGVLIERRAAIATATASPISGSSTRTAS